jgi:RNA polymerase sigma factor (sigma-70 family)
MLGDWEKLWEATIPLVKMQYGRMVRSGAVPEPECKGDDHWLNEMLLIAGEAMRKWDPDKGAFSTYIVSCVRLGIRNSLEKDARGGVTADHGIPIAVVSTEDARPGTTPDDDAPDDDGTYGAAMAYGGVVERGRRPDDAPEGLGDPGEEAERLQTQARLTAALACLPPEEREALLATQTEAQADYAALAGIPRTTVQSRVERALRRLRQFLDSAVN